MTKCRRFRSSPAAAAPGLAPAPLRAPAAVRKAASSRGRGDERDRGRHWIGRSVVEPSGRDELPGRRGGGRCHAGKRREPDDFSGGGVILDRQIGGRTGRPLRSGLRTRCSLPSRPPSWSSHRGCHAAGPLAPTNSRSAKKAASGGLIQRFIRAPSRTRRLHVKVAGIVDADIQTADATRWRRR